MDAENRAVALNAFDLTYAATSLTYEMVSRLQAKAL
jgi:hypothetical protein